VRGPGVRGIASLIDVMPTLLELAGLDSPDEAQGRSLFDSLHGVEIKDRTLFAESLNQEAVIRFPFLYYRDRKDLGNLTTHRVSKGRLRHLEPRRRLLSGAGDITGSPDLAQLERTLRHYQKLRDRWHRTQERTETEELRRDLCALGYTSD
jgi:arylsulfatase A-like enzyme